jgi:hypothetical protein
MRRLSTIVWALAGMAATAQGETVEFVVDPDLSQWSMRGAYYPGGQEQGDLFPQVDGSQITSLTGLLRVDITPDTIQFLPGSFLDALPQPQPQSPGIGGASGSAAADYGMVASTLPSPSPVFATRDFGFALTSDPIPLFDFQSHLQFAQDMQASGNFKIDYDLGATIGTLERVDWSRGFDDDSQGRLITEGSVQRIELQNYLGEIFLLQSPADLFVEWAGPIVATRVVPEPSSWTLLLAAGAALGVLRNWHRPKR